MFTMVIRKLIRLCTTSWSLSDEDDEKGSNKEVGTWPTG